MTRRTRVIVTTVWSAALVAYKLARAVRIWDDHNDAREETNAWPL